MLLAGQLLLTTRETYAMRRAIEILLILLLLLVGGVQLTFAPFWNDPPPRLQDGDLIFQTSRAQHALRVMAGMASLYNHVGIIAVRGGRVYVLDSAGSVKYTPLQKWVQQGYGKRYAIYRPMDLSAAQRRALFEAASRYEGVKYDFDFL